ncbi:MAG: hypothetical protein H3C59_01985 [Burkholderiaceae bacterium]|nr:hypothetical protein [Burkholderiaceae bacterium]
MEDAVRIVGRRKEREITFHASGEALVEGARFTADLRRLPGAGSTFIPKGVYRFRTHEEADRQRRECLAAGMAVLALERSRR